MRSSEALARRGGRSASGRFAAVASSLLVLLLPMLVVGARLDRPVGPAERALVQRCATGATPPADSAVVRMFVMAPIGGLPAPANEAAWDHIVTRARLTQMLAVGAITWLTYLTVLLAAGRVPALLACLALVMLPPVGVAGPILRAEAPGTLFVLLTLLLLQNVSPGRFRGRRPEHACRLTFGFAGAAAIAGGLACATLPSLGEVLLVPAFVLLLGTVQLALRGARCLRRRSFVGVPIRAINRRLLPWTTVLLAMSGMAAWLMLHGAPGPDLWRASAPACELLPAAAWARALSMVLVAVGVLVVLVRVGARFGRGGRLGPDVVLLTFCAVFLLTASTGGDEDPLPHAPAMAMLLAEGGWALLAVSTRSWHRRR